MQFPSQTALKHGTLWAICVWTSGLPVCGNGERALLLLSPLLCCGTVCAILSPEWEVIRKLFWVFWKTIIVLSASIPRNSVNINNHLLWAGTSLAILEGPELSRSRVLWFCSQGLPSVRRGWFKPICLSVWSVLPPFLLAPCCWIFEECQSPREPGSKPKAPRISAVLLETT